MNETKKDQTMDGFLTEVESKEIRDCTQMVSQEYRSEEFVSLDKIIPILRDPMADTGDLNVRLVAAEKAMGIVVHKYFSGFNKTIHNYSQIKTRMDQINANIKEMKKGLIESRSKIITAENEETAKRSEEIAEVYKDRLEQGYVLEYIKTIKWLLQVPQEIKEYTSQNYYLHAILLINRACNASKSPAIQKVVDLKKTLDDMERFREQFAYIMKNNLETLCMKYAMGITSTSMTAAEIEYAKHQQINQYPHRYTNYEIDAEMCIQENLALKPDYDYNEQMYALSNASCVLGDKISEQIAFAVLEGTVNKLSSVFGLHRLSLDKKVPEQLSFIDSSTFQKIKGKTQHLSSVDRFDMCLKVVFRLICVHVALCTKMEEFKRTKMPEYSKSICLDEINISFATSAVSKLKESNAAIKRSGWGRKLKAIQSKAEQELKERVEKAESVELTKVDENKGFVNSCLELAWSQIQNLLIKVLNNRIFESEHSNQKEDVGELFSFANCNVGGEKEENQNEKYKLAKKTLTKENIKKLIVSLESFIKDVSKTCQFEPDKFNQLRNIISMKKDDLAHNLFDD
ncbi:hypothetical protein ENUP19_0276G0002 [Entamoeba nuttalli]|uniref:Exocyst complex component Sec8 n=1 Tax=Entamoeba nuttalli TaxID=412467 RepID=A0ABQ0DTP7_9EUKA